MKDNEIEVIRHNLIEALGRSTSIWGVNETLGRLYGLLYLADEPLSLDEMAAELAVSKATISINIRILERIKCVQKVWQKGKRKDYYIAERDFEKILQELLRTNAADELLIQKTSITDALNAYGQILSSDLPPELKAQAERDIKKVQILADWIRIGEKWLNFFIGYDFSQEPAAEIRHIEVEWEDE